MLFYKVTNNAIGYEAMITGLELAKELGAVHIELKSRSELVVNQVQDLRGERLLDDAMPEQSYFFSWSIENKKSFR